MAHRLILAALIFFLAGCVREVPIVRTETVHVDVPIEVRPEIPPLLLAPWTMELPQFVDPEHPQATVALTQEGAVSLRILLIHLYARDSQWRAWATAE